MAKSITKRLEIFYAGVEDWYLGINGKYPLERLVHPYKEGNCIEEEVEMQCLGRILVMLLDIFPELNQKEKTIE